MRVNLPYILCALLFMTAALLGRVEPSGASCRADVRMGHTTLSPATALHESPCAASVLAPTTSAGDTDAGRYFNLSFFAPELTASILSQNTDHKAPPRTLSIAGYDVCVRPAVAASGAIRIVDSHSCGVDYYVFALEKIRI